MKKHQREFVKAARNLGISDIRIVRGGKHLRLIGKHGETPIFSTFSSSAHQCGIARKKCDLKRAMKGKVRH